MGIDLTPRDSQGLGTGAPSLVLELCGSQVGPLSLVADAPLFPGEFEVSHVVALLSALLISRTQ